VARSAKGRPEPADEPEPDNARTVPESEAPAPRKRRRRRRRDADADEAPADPSLCPRCGGKLTNPDGIGWCPGCGYCRSLEDEGAEVAPPPEPAAPKQPSALGAAEFGVAMRRVPLWFWPLLGGVAVVGGASVAADYLLPEECLARALTSALQMVLSVVGLVAAQLWAMMIVGAHEEGLGARDVILPGRLWRATFRRLPATRLPVWLGAWSVTALVCGAAVIGGFNYWLEVVREERVRRLAERLAQTDARADSGRESVKALGLAPNVPVLAADDNRPVKECVVIGYQTDGRTVTGVVLAMADAKRDQLLFAGVVRHGLTPKMCQELMDRLSRLRRKEPLIPGLAVNGTIWVNPGVFCDVIRPDDKLAEGEEPTIKGLKD
jgi:hypothetical protein